MMMNIELFIKNLFLLIDEKENTITKVSIKKVPSAKDTDKK